ncbi:MAG: DUF4488 domain-containing protein [Bacteroidaceae bacterium]|nr:DUF4488 domain-containing protein [Bacteroidaceae bacterium]
MMMRKFTIFALMLLSVSIAFAQKVHPIVGLWQQTNVVKLNDGREFLNRLPVYKLVNNDGTYVGILDYVTTISPDDALPSNMPMQTNSTVIAQKGTYEIENDSVYNEFITDHYLNKALVITTSKLKYKFCDSQKNLLRIEYYNESLQQWIPEMWTRVVPPQENKVLIENK